MDALREITEHSAYRRYKNERIMSKRMLVIKEVNKLKSYIAENGLTERVKNPGQEYAHYKECFKSSMKDGENYDYPETCVCCFVAMDRFRILQLLDDIEAMGGGSILKRLKDSFLASRNGVSREGGTSCKKAQDGRT